MVKVNTVVKTKARKFGEDDGEEPGPSEQEIWAALEAACSELGYSLDEIENFHITGTFPDELLEAVMGKTGCQDKDSVRQMLNPQRASVLKKVIVLQLLVIRA